MAKRDEVFPSKYLKAADLNGKPITVTIQSATLETLKTLEGKEQPKTVLGFKGARKTDRWPGHAIEIYPTTTTMQGKPVDCIRIRPPAQRELPKVKPRAPKPPDADDMDDDIPF
jgi:hypothetical protein